MVTDDVQVEFAELLESARTSPDPECSICPFDDILFVLDFLLDFLASNSGGPFSIVPQMRLGLVWKLSQGI